MKKLVILLLIVLIITSAVFIFIKKGSKPPLTLPPNQKIKQITKSLAPKLTSPNYIVVIVMENKSSTEILNNPQAPYINSLAKKYTLAENYHGVSHPSLPNYLALLGGSTFGINSDCTNCFINAPNLVDELEKAHKKWRAYMESMPSSCFSGSTNLYAQKHDPFFYFNDIRNNPRRCGNIVPLDTLSRDLSSSAPPNFIWITPNICHDMHDCSIKTGDDWLSQEIPQITNSPSFKSSNFLIVITWDEGENNSANQIPTILMGSKIKQASSSNTFYTHYSLLHTIENLWSLSPLTTNDQKSPIMSDFFTVDGH